MHYEKIGKTERCIEEEIPFTLPNGWSWTKINTIAFVTKLAGFEYTNNIAPNLCESGVPLFKGKNVQNSKIIYEFESYIPEQVSDELSRSQITRKCILTPYVGTIGNIGIHSKVGKYHLGSNVGKVELYNANETLLEEYVVAYLKSSYGYSELTKHMKATAQASISIEAIRDVYIPVPPANEQYRIVHKLNELLSFVDTIETDKTSLQDLIKQTKSKILDLAIKGKLVPQDPNDEPASVLLDRIRAEKEELIKQGKIKRDKKESVIFRGDDNSYYEKIGDTVTCIDEELSFDIPDNWEWIRLSSACIINPKNSIDDDTVVSFVPMTLIQDGYGNAFTFVQRKWSEVKKGFTHFAENDVGFAKITPCFENRKSVVFRGLCNGYGAGTTELHILRAYPDTILPDYFLYLVKTESFISGGKQTFSGAVGQQRVGKEYVYNYLCPVPPLSEQKRIIEKCSEIMTILHSIEKSLS